MMRSDSRCVRVPVVLLWIVGLVWMAGCESPPKPSPDPFTEKWRTLAQESVQPSRKMPAPVPQAETDPAGGTMPATAASADLPALDETPIAAQVEEPALPTLPVTLKMYDVDLKVLLRTLARAAGQSILINENVSGSATLSIQQTPWDQVFRGLLASHGLTYRWQGDILRVVGAEDLKRDRELIEENQKILTTRKEYALKIKQLESRTEQAEILETRILAVRYGDPVKIRDNLETFLESAAGGQGDTAGREQTGAGGGRYRPRIVVDEHTNSLLIQAVRRDIERIAGIVAQLDRPPLQVRIEAHIVEASEDTARALGIQWGGVSQHVGNVNTYLAPNVANALGTAVATRTQQTNSAYDSTTTPPESRTSSVSETLNAVDPVPGMAANFPAAISGSSALSLGFIAEKLGQSVLAVQLTALQEEGRLHIVSSPSITTLDNQKARIESGKQVPYQTVENDEVKIEFKDASLVLEVTPHVIDSEAIKLQIQTENSELDFANAVGGQPAITTKAANTTVVLFDGQTTVIGGLTKERGEKAKAGVPYFKDVPLLGNLFKNSGRARANEQLLIFITPHILQSD